MTPSGSGSGTKTQPRGERGVLKKLDQTLDNLLPESEYPSGTNDRDRKLRLKAVKDFSDTQTEAQKTYIRIREALDEEDDSQGERRESDDRDREARRESDESARNRAERRKDYRQVLEGIERERSSRDRSRIENTLIVLMTFTVLSAITLAFIGVLRHQPIWLGGTGLSSLLSGGEAYVFRIVHQKGGPVNNMFSFQATEDPEPFKWSAIEAQASMAEE